VTIQNGQAAGPDITCIRTRHTLTSGALWLANNSVMTVSLACNGGSNWAACNAPPVTITGNGQAQNIVFTGNGVPNGVAYTVTITGTPTPGAGGLLPQDCQVLNTGNPMQQTNVGPGFQGVASLNATGYPYPLTFVGAPQIQCSRALSCNDLKTKDPGQQNGFYPIDPDGSGPQPKRWVYCNYTLDQAAPQCTNGNWVAACNAYSYWEITGGQASSAQTDPNTCQGTGSTYDILAPRSQVQLNDLIGVAGLFPGIYHDGPGNQFRTALPGVYRTKGAFAGANGSAYSSCAMNSIGLGPQPNDCDPGAGSSKIGDWSVVGVSQNWYLSKVNQAEPSGDYMSACWLGFWGPFSTTNGFTLNDAQGNACDYSTGQRYLCSDNVHP
jgi:hypothetical protein